MSARAIALLRSPSAWAQGLLLAALACIAFALLRWQGELPHWPAPARARALGAVAALVAWLALCAAIAWRRIGAGREQQRLATAPRPANDEAEANRVLVVHASQTGYAIELATRTATSLREAGLHAALQPLGRLDSEALRRAGRVLFVASTTGEGDAPDASAAFVRDVLAVPADLRGLRYGLLALGDREYRNFCGFGRRLDAWLRHGGAEPLFDAVEVDDGDEGALRHWQHHLGLLAGNADLPDWSAPSYACWRLCERRLLNPGSVGGACFHLELEPAEGLLPAWRAGDIAEIGPCHADTDVQELLRELDLDGDLRIGDDRAPLRERLARSAWPALDELRGRDAAAVAARLRPLPHREYSIASIPADGAIHLLVRRMQRADGTPGLGSGWLTTHAPIGADIALRIRANPNFHAPDDARPLILVGNGSGIAGLRSLLKERITAGRHRNWLLFGERHAAHDFHYRDEILRWREQGFIERLDLAFSRDEAGRTYVQHRLAAAAPVLRGWIDEGAAVHVCGSLEGMAPGVHGALVDVLGKAAVERMLADGRYRRDVY